MKAGAVNEEVVPAPQADRDVNAACWVLPEKVSTTLPSTRTSMLPVEACTVALTSMKYQTAGFRVTVEVTRVVAVAPRQAIMWNWASKDRLSWTAEALSY